MWLQAYNISYNIEPHLNLLLSTDAKLFGRISLSEATVIIVSLAIQTRFRYFFNVK